MKYKVILGVVGGFLSSALGGWDVLLKTLLILVILDYITGLTGAIYRKEISSYVGFNGILKKFVMFCVICLSAFVGEVVATEIRDITVVFYISNEGISIIENAVKCDVPVPDKLKQILKIIHTKKENENEGEDDENS